jgi:hypothetical protein
MAHTFPAILKSVNVSVNSKKITFELSPEHYDMYKAVLSEEPGVQCLLALYIVGDDAEDITNAYNDPNYQKNNLLKRIYAIIGDYSLQTGVSEQKIKELLKLRLQSKGLINKSLSELDEHNSATAVFTLQTNMNPNTMDYGKHKD